MDNLSMRRARLSLPLPYILFYPPPRAGLGAEVNNPAVQVPTPNVPYVNGKWALDAAPRPTVTVQGVAQRMGNAFVIDGQGNPGPNREKKYAEGYAWAAALATGEVVPRGRQGITGVQMLGPNLKDADTNILRFRWRGTAAAAIAVGDGDGTAGPFSLNLPDHGGAGPPPPQPPPIVPGTVKITAPYVAGGSAVVRDLPWPIGEWKRECRYGFLIGNHDPEVDFKANGYIDYQTGLGVILFDAPIVNAANNIVADFEHEWVPTPLDLILAWDALMT